MSPCAPATRSTPSRLRQAAGNLTLLVLLLLAWPKAGAQTAPVPAAQPGAEAGSVAVPASCLPADPLGRAGAYRLPDGHVVSVLPDGEADQWRLIDFGSGRSHRLHPAGDGSYRSAADFHGASPEAFRYRFSPAGAGMTLQVQPLNGAAWSAERLALPTRPISFRSGDTPLAGQLTLPPAGQPVTQAVVFVHGSDPVPSMGREWLAHLLASRGVATLVFDKRGTGCSKGAYGQHVGVLSDDVVAAVGWLKRVPELGGLPIGLAGFSQGGWVAPLAAHKDPSIRFVLVGYGLAMSMADEDRLEAPLKLRERGADDQAVAEFETLNAALHRAARDGFRDWRPFDEAFERFRDRPWMAALRGTRTWMDWVLQTGLTQAKAQAPAMFEHFFQPFYEPLPTLQALSVPMLWLVPEDDIEAPPGPTLAALAQLRAQGKPVAVRVFPGADHGLVTFVVREGRRVPTAYAPGAFAAIADWVLLQR
jgi:hypothetical protein